MTKAEHLALIAALPTYVSMGEPAVCAECTCCANLDNATCYNVEVVYSDGTRTAHFTVLDEGEETEQMVV